MPEITLQRIYDEMRKTHEAFKAHVDKQLEEVRANGHASTETTAAIEKINSDLTDLRKTHDELTAASNRPSGAMTGAGEDRSEDEKKAEMELRKSAFMKYIRYGNGEAGRSMMSPEESRALSQSSDSDGGFLVPVDFENELITQAFDEAAIRPLANVKPTSRDVVQLGAISKPVVAWGNADIAISPQELEAGGERITIFPVRGMTAIHNDTMDDAVANIWAELLDQFSMAIAEAEDDAFATGAGNNSPQGVIAHPSVLANYRPTKVAAALSDASNDGVQALISVLYALKKTYRRNATWAMNSGTEAEVRKLKNSNGDYLWQPPVQAGAPPTLLGRPFVNPEGMPDIAANSYPIVCGDFKKGYNIRDRSGVTVRRLLERYAEYDQTGFVVKRRTGGQVTLPEAFACLKVATT